MIYKLFLDETGTCALPIDDSRVEYFVLSGVAVREEQRQKLKIRADQVKYRHWRHTNIVFHSREIGLRIGDFAILRDPAIETDFHKDLFLFLDQSGMKYIVVSVNKVKALELQWDYDQLYTEAADAMLNFFIEFLITRRSRGQIIIESAGTIKDILFYKRYIYYLAHGLPSLDITPQKMKEILTSVSFVSKNNRDIETQIADLLAYPAMCQSKIDDGIFNLIPNSYEEKLCAIFKTKLIFIDGRTSFIKAPPG